MISHIDIGYNGRLGNQLFLYALLFKLDHLGKEVVVPSQNYNVKFDGCLDQYSRQISGSERASCPEARTSTS